MSVGRGCGKVYDDLADAAVDDVLTLDLMEVLRGALPLRIEDELLRVRLRVGGIVLSVAEREEAAPVKPAPAAGEEAAK